MVTDVFSTLLNAAGDTVADALSAYSDTHVLNTCQLNDTDKTTQEAEGQASNTTKVSCLLHSITHFSLYYSGVVIESFAS